jgi:hypothetical protein
MVKKLSVVPAANPQNSFKKSRSKSKVVEITSAAAPAPFEYPVRLERMAELLEDHSGFKPGTAARWLREKVRDDSVRNPDPIPSTKRGKYRFFVVSEVLAWLKKAA